MVENKIRAFHDSPNYPRYKQLRDWENSWRIQRMNIIAEMANYLQAGGRIDDEYYKELSEKADEYAGYLQEIEDEMKKLLEDFKAEQPDEQKKPGRPQLGLTRKVSLTLTPETWAFLDRVQYDQDFRSLSETLRYVLEKAEIASNPDNWGNRYRLQESRQNA